MSIDVARQELRQLAAAYQDAAETLAVCRIRLHQRVLAAVDVDGMTATQVARTLGVTRPRINQIIVKTAAAAS